MKTNIVTIFFIAIAFLSCESPEIFEASKYTCNSEVPNTDAHPRANQYQAILDNNRNTQNIVGATLMVKDEYGIWIGASGKADIASNIDVKPCNRFLLASITKSFTAAAIFKYIDSGDLSLEMSVKGLLPNSIVENLSNVKESKLKHLLNHTSGIPDYYTTNFELDRINKVFNNWTPYDILASYTYNQEATNAVGETYYYSNTNYLLLGIILERLTNKKLSQIYQETIFTPLNLGSGYYSASNPIPSDLVKGYVDFYGNNQYVESEFLYKDELGTADGGIAMNAYDLGLFFEYLIKGDIVSQSSLQSMTSWFDLPSDWVDEDFGHFKNGYGLEYNKTPYGNSVGHTGGIDGFLTIAQYFPESDKTFVLLVNSGSYENQGRLNIYNETLKLMFQESN